MAEANVDKLEVKKSKNGVRKFFGFGKKKKKSIPEEYAGYCPYCAQKNVNLNASQSTIDAYEEKQRMLREEANRKQPNFGETKIEMRPEAAAARPPPPLPPAASSSASAEYRDVGSTCKCTRCRRQRGEDPLTVELLPMDTQVTLQNSLLQNSLQDAGFMCCIL